jgi:hypothetical protein
MSGFVFASDLDRTLIFPARSLPEDQRLETRVVEHYQGRGITVASRAVIEALDALAAAGAFVPVTARSREQFERVTSIWRIAQSGYAICANGATVLHHGQPDAEWETQVTALARESATLAEVRRAVVAELGSPDTVDWMPLLRDCDQHFLYATLDLNRVPVTLAEDAGLLLAPFGWRAVLHARKLYALPHSICKGAATEYVVARLDADRVMAAGDSELDIELLLVAQDRWCPAGAELVQRDKLPQGTRITEELHARSGTQIAHHAAAQIRIIRR